MSHAQLKERELRAAAMLIVSTEKHGTYLHDLQWLAFNCCIEAVAGARKTCDCCPPGTQGWQGHAAWVDPRRHCQSCCYRALVRSSFHRPNSVSSMPWNQMFVISDVCHPYDHMSSIVLCYLLLTDIQAMRQMIWQMWPLLAWPAAQIWVIWAGTTEM